MKRSLFVAVVFVMLFPAAAMLHAQGGGVDGCVDSPECPTAVLGLVGSAGIGIAFLRTKMAARRKK